MRDEYTEMKGLSTVTKSLQKEIPQKMKEYNIPGLALALVSKSGTMWSQGFGYTDMSGQHAVNTDTLFCLQSTTKTVTTVAFLLAVQKGLINLDDLLVDYYPEFTVKSRVDKDEYKKITFRHLLSHSSGLTREAQVGGVFNYVPCTWEEHIQSISGSWLKFPVGKWFSYSNAGMDLVVYALERITGMAYPAYVQKVLGDPLGITYYYDTRNMYEREDTAKGYLGDMKAACIDPVGLGCGAAHLSIRDQATFVRFLLNLGTVNGRKILNADYVNAMRAADKEGWYGLGTFVTTEDGVSLVFHPGGGFGFISEMYWVPEYNCGVAVFTNQEYADNYGSILAKKAVKCILKAQGVSLKPTAFPFDNTPVKHIRPEVLDRLSGVYSGTWDSVTVGVDQEKLYMDYGGKIELIPHTETAFSAESPKGVVFQLHNGSPVSLKMYSTGVFHLDYRGRPPEPPGPHKKEWEKFTGLYQVVIYGTDRVHCGVNVEDDGYLHVRWGSSKCAYQHEGIQNLFFLFNGDAVVFADDHMRYDNVYWKKIDDPVAFFTELYSGDGHREWILDNAADTLRYLGRHKEAEEILQLKHL
jgi:CubicO group peptidase (beta-lactamase class C family)